MSKNKIYEAEWVSVHCLSMQQICDCAQVEEARVIELVDSEVLCPINQTSKDWLFLPQDLTRLTKANRLMHEFDLSPLGLALVFDLLDELQALRQLVPD
jgi:chaperone modulatory protein CbpM